MAKVATIVGARPQFIKAACVSREIAAVSGLSEVIVHTGQHYDADMSEIFFEQLSIPHPDYNLGIGSGLHGAMTGRQLEKIEEVLIKEEPDWVLVYGDTNSTLAGALAASKLHIPVMHVEAGLRSFNRQMPEEINRVLTDHIATLLFAPTVTAQENLQREGIVDSSIYLVGDVMYDASLFYGGIAEKPEWFDAANVECGEFVLCTIHRAENTDNPTRIKGIFKGLADSGVPIILPLHPRTRAKVEELGIVPARNVIVTDPVGYLNMIWLEKNCRSIATDSGGVQKEAFFHGRMCVTLREETEWVELVRAGYNSLAGSDPILIATQLRREGNVVDQQAIYGSGDAARRIVKVLTHHIASTSASEW